MKADLKNKAEALKTFLEAMKTLKDEGILINKKDFTCQIGEWLVEMLYGGKRAEKGIQKDWDIDLNGFHTQVKTHAKSKTNNQRWSRVSNNVTEKLDELIIIVFSEDYKLQEFYKIPWVEALPLIKERGIKPVKPNLDWSSVIKYRIKIEDLPNQEIVSLFK